MRIGALAFGLAVLLSACQSTGPITAEDSMFRLALADGEWPSITRDLVEVQEHREEVWDWPSGALRAIRAGRMKFYRNDFAEPEDLLRAVGEWPTFVRADVNRRDVKTGENEDGPFLHATAVKRDRICFFMLQPIPEIRPPNTMPIPPDGLSDGFVTFYHCAARAATTLEAMEAEGLTFANALARSW